MKQFDRQYRFSANGFTVGETSRRQPTAMHIKFAVEKADTEAPNSAKISLWNLSPEHLSILNQKDCLVTLKAGYGGMMPLIFVGTISYISTELEGADRKTEMEVVDGRVELRDTFVTLSYSGKINSRKIIQDIAGEMGITVTFSYNAVFYDFPNGFACVCSARTALDKACTSSALQWQIQNGILQIKMRYDTMTREVFVLAADSGLIGVPKKIMISPEGVMLDPDGSGDEERPGYEAEYLLNGAIGIGDYVRLESKTAQGYFRIHSIVMDGDNLEGDWMCTARLVEA
ncbi:MAG: hypothetical protein LBS84_03250 [Clostridiales bacterium]|jgi:hypothetical protein|nr:hypothetical protein [Clostridiales bacterium]